MEIIELPNVEVFGAARGAWPLASFLNDAEARFNSFLGLPGFFKTPMKYVEKHFSLRIHRRDGTSKLLLGVLGSPRKIGSLMQIKVAKDKALKVKVVDHPRGDEPAEAIEV